MASRLPSCWTEGGKADREGARKCGRVRVGELLWAAQDGLPAPTWVSVLSKVKGERQETSISSNLREESQVADAKAAMIVAFQVSACSRCGSRFERGRQDGTGEPGRHRGTGCCASKQARPGGRRRVGGKGMDERRMEGEGERAGIYATRKRRGAAPRRVARLRGGQTRHGKHLKVNNNQ